MLPFRLGAQRGTLGDGSYPAALRILGLAFLIDGIKNDVPGFVRQNVGHFDPARCAKGHSPVIVVFFGHGLHLDMIPGTLPARELRPFSEIVIWPLRRVLVDHLGIVKHVERVEEVEKMAMWSLLTLAKKMGVDSNEMIRRTEQAERELSDYSWNYPGFKGELPFDLTFSRDAG